MIKLNGPRLVEAGSAVCITATNVGAGFSAIADPASAGVHLKVTIDLKKHTATICFVAPAAGTGVIIHVTDSVVAKGSSHSLIVRR